MDLYFSLSAADWLAYIKSFFDILVDFFNYIGIKLFTDSPDPESETAAPTAEGE